MGGKRTTFLFSRSSDCGGLHETRSTNGEVLQGSLAATGGLPAAEPRGQSWQAIAAINCLLRRGTKPTRERLDVRLVRMIWTANHMESETRKARSSTFISLPFASSRPASTSLHMPIPWPATIARLHEVLREI
jgi:hypothetical protein